MIDAWALGIMLYDLLFNDVPFYKEDEGVHVEAIMNEEIDFEHAQWLGLSFELQDLIDQLLQKKPGLRLSPSKILSHPWIKGSG